MNYSSDTMRKKKFRKAAGSWSDIDTDKLIKEIYADRKKRDKKRLSFD